MYLGYTQRNFLLIWRRYKRTLFLRRGQPCQDMPKRHGICSDAKLGTPFFSNDFCEAVDAGFRETVVSLSGVAVNTAGRGDVDYAAGFVVSNAEVGRGFADKFERRSVVEGEDVFPLFIGHLLDVGSVMFVRWEGVEDFPFGGKVAETEGILELFYLVYYAIPGISTIDYQFLFQKGWRGVHLPRIIDNDMNLPIPELSRLFNKCLKVLGIQHVARDS